MSIAEGYQLSFETADLLSVTQSSPKSLAFTKNVTWHHGLNAVASVFDTVDLRLFDLGFCRTQTTFGKTGSAIYTRSSDIDDVGLLVQPRRHVISMPTLGTNGRLANQLFQALFVALCGLRHNCEVQTPHCDVHDLFDFPFAPRPDRPLPRFNFGNNHGDAALMLEAEHPPRNVEVWGYFQHVTAAHRTHARLVRRMLRPKTPMDGAITGWLAELRKRSKRLIGVHIRRGDYEPFDGVTWDKFTQAPTEWYLNWLRENRSIGRDDVVLVASDDAAVRREFADYRLAHDVAPPPAGVDPRLLDLAALSACDVTLYCNSSWSFIAAMLADDRQLAHIVDFKKRSLIPFDPWSGEDFWLPYDAPHRHEIDLPFRLSSRALQEQKYLDRWRAQAELAFMLRHPWRSLFSLVKQRVFGARFTTATLQRLFPERDLYAFRTMSDRQRSRRRQLRALVNGRGRISNQSLDIG